MYDVLRASYRFHCPSRPDGEMARVPLSSFRRLERLPGAVHPAVYRVEYDCPCGDRHLGLVSHGDLDYGPLATVRDRVPEPAHRAHRAGGRRAGRARPLPGAARELAVAAVLQPEARHEAGVAVVPGHGGAARGRRRRRDRRRDELSRLRRDVAEPRQRAAPGRAVLPRQGRALRRPAVWRRPRPHARGLPPPAALRPASTPSAPTSADARPVTPVAADGSTRAPGVAAAGLASYGRPIGLRADSSSASRASTGKVAIPALAVSRAGTCCRRRRSAEMSVDRLRTRVGDGTPRSTPRTSSANSSPPKRRPRRRRASACDTSRRARADCRRVAVAVVERLEAVEVEHHQGHAAAVAAHAGELGAMPRRSSRSCAGRSAVGERACAIGGPRCAMAELAADQA